jgi:uncharacterized protein
MRYSKYNMFSKMRGSGNHFLLNLLSGNTDILAPQEAAAYEERRIADPAPYIEKGYIVEEAAEEAAFRKAYLEFLDRRETDEIQLFYVPGYACNFQCSYCYQSEYPGLPDAPEPGTVIDAFLRYAGDEFGGRRKYVTLFGGEPLLPGGKARETVERLIRGTNDSGLGLAVVTNGYHLGEYIPILEKGKIREIQVTLDGVGPLHDARRPLKNGQGTFERIVKGIDLALDKGFPVNLRFVADRENLGGLPELAGFAIDRGWTGKENFKTQIGRNYELHTCQQGREKLYSRLGLYEDLYAMIREHPHVLEFHKPAFSVSRFLAENGTLPEPLFDACPGCKLEWAFDFRGDIYPCTATVGKSGERVGRFYPERSLDSARVSEWQERDVLSIEKCAGCGLSLACGGGCASVAANAAGSINGPDCRPVKELLELGLDLYTAERRFERSEHERTRNGNTVG